MTTTSQRATPTRPDTPSGRSALFNVLLGLASLAVLLQGLWAGIFLEHDGKRDQAQSWIEVHARGADVAIVLAALATVVAFAKLRERRDLWLGSAVLTVVLLVESYIGGLVGDHAALTAVHVPLAMALMALVVWLPMRAARRR